MNRKVRRKNQIPKYHASSPEGDEDDTRAIDRWKNLLTQWGTEEENRKIYEVWFGEKTS